MDRVRALIPACLLLAAGCGATTAGAPPAPATDSAPVVAAGDGVVRQAPPARPDHVAADVRFMQDMIVHHRQAVEMTGLARERAGSDEIRLLARRIDRSQEDELERMRAWLARRGAAVPDEHAHHGAHAAMPGMASAEEMARLRTMSGAAFDRLFLELMIRHHEGALTMVAQLFATPGAGQEPELFQFASHVDADQRMEIARMRRMLQ